MNKKFEEKLYQFYPIFLTFFGVVTFLTLIVILALIISIFPVIVLFIFPLIAGIWRSITAKGEKYEYRIDLNNHMKLGKIIHDLSKNSGIELPSDVYVTEGSEIAVWGFRKKKMVVGLASLRFLTAKDIKSILAHEYGHYHNNDTVWGFMTGRIRYFLDTVENYSKESIDLDWGAIINIPTAAVFYLLNTYYNLVAQWYNRKKEYDADKFASKIVGEQQFAEALVKYSIVDELFQHYARAYISALLKDDQMFTNIYTYLGEVYKEEDIPKVYHAVMKDSSSYKDSHPSISERMQRLSIKEINLNLQFTDKHYFENQELFEQKASEKLTHNVAFWEAVAHNQELE